MKKNVMLFIYPLISLVMNLITLPGMADTVPMHFGVNGEADRYGSKYEMFIITAMLVVMAVIAIFQERAAQKKADSEKAQAESKVNSKATSVIITAVALVMLVVQFMVYATAKEMATSLSDTAMMVLSFAMGMVFIVLGNISPKIKRNSMVGMRTKWSMANDRTWRLCQTCMGYLFLILGFITIVTELIFGGMTGALTLVALMPVAIIIMTVYSYKVYQKYGKDE